MSKQSSDSSSAQRSYSVDEMMARLRDGEREKRQQEEGELVTRADGTQVVRVRRRKRRTKQPEIEARKRKKRSLKLVLPLVISLVVALGVAVILLIAKYNSRSFQDGFESGLEEFTGSRITIERLRVTPVKIRATSVRSEWPTGSMLADLELTGLEGDLDLAGFVGGSWKGEEILATRGRMELRTGMAARPLGQRPAGSRPMEYERLRCRFFDMRLGDEKSGGLLVKNTDATLLTEGDMPAQVHFRGGELTVAGWDPMILDRGMGQMTGDGLEIISFHASPKDDPGELNLTTAAPVSPGSEIQLNVDIKDFPLNHLVGAGFDTMFSGVVSSKVGTMVFANDGAPTADVRLEFSGKEAGMTRLPFLENLRTIFGATDYVRPEFDSIHGVFRRSALGAELQGLVLESKGKMVVRGSLELDADDALSGNLEVGIPESRVILATGRKRTEVFGNPIGGYCWVMLRIEGDAENPEDNFKILLQKAAREAYERRDERSTGDRFDELTQPR